MSSNGKSCKIEYMFLGHLHLHSYYSFLRGLASPIQLAKKAVDNEMSAAALTDYGNLVGAIEFYDACLQFKVKPILGLEANLTIELRNQFGQYELIEEKLVFLANEDCGWRSLCKITSKLSVDEKKISGQAIQSSASGLVCLAGGWGSSLRRLIREGDERTSSVVVGQLKEIFGDRVYLELSIHEQHDIHCCRVLNEFGNKNKIPTVAAHSVYYLDPAQAHLQEVVSAIRVNSTLYELSEADYAPPSAFFPNREQMEKRFADFPGAIERTQEIIDNCHCELPLGRLHFPQLELAEGETALDVVRRKAFQRAIEIYGAPTPTPSAGEIAADQQLEPEIRRRLEYELNVIEQTGYAPLFLVVKDILDFARKNGVPTASRGSASSSLVAHCLGITTPDPIRLNLYFERFLNPARHSPPDIDTDVCSRRRDEVIQYTYQRFGEEKVATVCTINCFRSRSSMREVAKAHGLPADEVKLLADALPYRWFGASNLAQKNNNPYDELRGKFHDAKHQAVFEDAIELIGLPHHLSVHPGGVVISPCAMDDLAPTETAAKGIRITQFDMKSIERLGLVKIDLLGIRGLTVIGEVAETLLRNTVNAQFPTQESGHLAESLQLLEGIPEKDEAVSQSLTHGKTIGCFQIESPGMRATLKEIHARSVDDILVALALYRPGPLTGGLKDAFVRRHLMKEPASYLHSSLEPLLNETYGVILYQEQVLRIAHELAGFSLAEADLLRRAMSHFDPGKQMEKLQEKFIHSANQVSGVPQEAGQKIWDLMAAFAGYGFPKAHAASYAQVAWRAAWCKIHHPSIFMAAVLANWGGYYSQRVYLTEARRMGLNVRTPHINYAQREFSYRFLDEKQVLFMGLDQIKDLTQKTIAAILSKRPFLTFDNFLSKVNPRQGEVVNLIKTGALEGFGSIPALLQRVSGKRQPNLQFSFLEASEPTGEDWSVAEQVAAQEEILGVSVIAHPLELAINQIQASHALTTVEAASRIGKRVLVAGMRQTWRRSITTHGDYIYFMALEDLEGMLDVVILGDVYRRSKAVLATPGPYFLEGIVEFDEEHGEPFIRADRIVKV